MSVLLGKGTTLAFYINGLSFGTELLHTASVGQSLTVINRGASALNITGITVTGANPRDFLQSNNCGTTLVAGASCAINVNFQPTQIGPRAASVSFADNAAGSPHWYQHRGET